MVPVLKNVGVICTAENYCPASLLSVFRKVFEKLVNNRLADSLEKWCLSSHFQYGFYISINCRSSLTVVFDKIARAFNMSEATLAVALDISKVFNRVWHDLFHKLKSCGISGQRFGFILSFHSNRQLLAWFWIGRLHKNIPLIHLFHMKITVSVTESLHQVCGSCYLHLPVSSYLYTLFFYWKIKRCCACCSPQQIRPQITVQLYIYIYTRLF